MLNDIVSKSRMTSGMANERKDEMIVMKVVMNRGFRTKEEQPDALNATSRAWENEMTGRHTRSRRGIKQVIAQDVERVTEKPLIKSLLCTCPFILRLNLSHHVRVLHLSAHLSTTRRSINFLFLQAYH